MVRAFWSSADSRVQPGGLTLLRQEPRAAQRRGKLLPRRSLPSGLLGAGAGGQPDRCSVVSPALQHGQQLRDTAGLFPDLHSKASVAMK